VLPALRDAGVDVAPCFRRESHPTAAELIDKGITPRFLDASRMNPFVALTLARIIRETGCRIVHAHGIKATLMSRVAARLTGTQVLLHVHDQKHPTLILRGLHRLFSSPSDIGICVSRAVCENAEVGYSVSADRTRVVHNGIRLEEFSGADESIRPRIRAEFNIPRDTIVLGMLARFYPVKGHRLMLEMFARIAERRPDVVLLLAGDGPERAVCEQMVQRLGLRERVRFLGHRSDVPALLTACDVFLMPSQTEGLPIAAIEAMAAGCPVVGFDVGGMAEVVEHRRNGVLVPANDTEAFVAAVLELVGNGSLRQQFARHARHATERFSVDHHVRDLVKCYEEAATTAASASKGTAAGSIGL
jgi:glycosyltransferase involved in cell wall biosynthesis